jgi:HK97 family phage portal protein
MATIQTADGRLLRVQRPATAGLGSSNGMPTWFPPMWSDGEREPNGLTDGLDGALVSFDRIYRSQPILAGVIDMIAFRAATLPFGAFEVKANGSRDAVDRSDALATLLRRPRPRASTVHLLNHIFTSLFVHGNALVAKLRTSEDEETPPDMLWPLDWARVSAYGEQGGDVEWWGTYQFGNQELFCRSEDTIHFAWPGPDGGPIGVSPLEKLGVTVQIEDAAQRFQKANFRNGNRPSNAVILPEKHTKDALDITRAGIESLHKGVDRAGRTIMLSGGAEIKPLSMSPVEASLIDQRRLDREEVAIVFGLSGPSLTDSTNSSLGNVAERFRAFYRDVLPPWATLVVETFEAQLVDPEPAWMDRVIRFDFSDKLRGEPQEQANTLKVLVEGGIVTRDEARADLGKAPKGGNAAKLTVNANNQATIESLETRSPEDRTPETLPAPVGEPNPLVPPPAADE